MIDRCDPEVATWSEAGDNFVVKNVEKFATVRASHTRKYSSDIILRWAVSREVNPWESCQVD